MSRVINAVFGNGVFKPCEKVDVNEHEKVEIKILLVDEWQERFSRIIEKLQKKSAGYSSAQITSDIVKTIKEVRKEKRGR